MTAASFTCCKCNLPPTERDSQKPANRDWPQGFSTSPLVRSGTGSCEWHSSGGRPACQHWAPRIKGAGRLLWML